MTRVNYRSRPNRKLRRGHAMVEFAVVAPVLFMILLGCIELSRVNMIRNTLATAAYEGCRTGIVPGATNSAATASAVTILRASLVSGETITINPTTITATSPSITVTVSVPVSSNGWIFSRFFKSANLQASCTLNRENTSS